MARPGGVSNLTTTTGSRSLETRRTLVEAAVATLKTHGFAGASARVIADEASQNQALIFYHFGSVANLLLAALDQVSAERLARYGPLVEAAREPQELAAAALRIFREDVDAGYVTVLVEMMSGASSTPQLGAEIAERIGPWFSFAQGAIERSFARSPLGNLLPAADVAYAVVAMYLGLEMLTHLNGERTRAVGVFEALQKFSALFGGVGPFTTTKETP